MIVTITANKGGVGKSFSCCVLAETAAASGENVVVFDTDPQQNAFSRLTDLLDGRVYATNGRKPDLQKMGVVAESDFVIIDTQRARESAAARESIRMADLVVIPTQTAAFAIEGMRETIEICKMDGKPFLILLMLPIRKSAVSKKEIEALEKEFVDRLIEWPNSEKVSRNIEARQVFYKGLTDAQYDKFDELYKAVKK